MKSRRHGRKPTFALWMIVAVADAALLAAAAGPLVTTLVIVGLVIVAGAFIGTRMAGPARPQPAKPLRRKA